MPKCNKCKNFDKTEGKCRLPVVVNTFQDECSDFIHCEITVEEAITQLQQIADYMNSLDANEDEQKTILSLGMAIETLQSRKNGRLEHGREVYREYIGDAIISRVYENWRCGKCKTLIAEQASKVVCNYCPHCGVKFADKEE